MGGAKPSAHKDGKPAHLYSRAGLGARQKGGPNAECYTEVIEGPDPQDATNIKLLDTDCSCRLALAEQQLADEEGAEGEEETKAEIACIAECTEGGNALKAGVKPFRRLTTRGSRVEGSVWEANTKKNARKRTKSSSGR